MLTTDVPYFVFTAQYGVGCCEDGWACKHVSGTVIDTRVGEMRIFGWARLTGEASNSFEVDLDGLEPQAELELDNIPCDHTSLVSLQVGLICYTQAELLTILYLGMNRSYSGFTD